MTDTRDRKARPRTDAMLAGFISGIVRTILTWIINQLDV